MHPDVRQALEQIAAAGVSTDLAWLLLAHWSNRRTGEPESASIAATLQPHLAGLKAGVVEQCFALFDHLLGRNADSTHNMSRMQRLQRALHRSLP